MTALSLETIVAQALAEVGAPLSLGKPERLGKARSTTWSPVDRGFGVRDYVSGKCVYVVQARMGGRQRVVTLGSAKVLTRAKALEVARRVQALALLGENPADTRARVRAAPAWTDFVEEYWQRCSPSWKPSTLRTHNSRRRNHLEPAFKGRFVDDIKHADVTKWFSRLTADSGPGGANRTVEIVRAMFYRAEDWGYRPINSNPVSELRMNRKRKCDRFLSEDELARLGAVLKRERNRRPAHADAVMLLILTGCRVGEVLALEWGDIHGRRVRLRDSKTGPRTVWLGEEARAVLSGVHRVPGERRVFVDRARKAPLKSVDAFWYQVRAEADLAGVRLHDLRHTFASHAAMGAETALMIGKLLGHAQLTSTVRYSHLSDDYLLRSANEIGAVLERVLC